MLESTAAEMPRSASTVSISRLRLASPSYVKKTDPAPISRPHALDMALPARVGRSKTKSLERQNSLHLLCDNAAAAAAAAAAAGAAVFPTNSPLPPPRSPALTSCLSCFRPICAAAPPCCTLRAPTSPCCHHNGLTMGRFQDTLLLQPSCCPTTARICDCLSQSIPDLPK